jgi:GNAT superfamily N-acetyltransferase
VEIDDQVSDTDARAVERGVLAFNEARIGPSHEQAVRFVVRGPDGAIVAGLLGVTRWRWLYVAKLWVAESQRGRQLGTRLMDAAEAAARARGCTHAYVDTFEYQARPFYEKRGYRLYGTLEGYPPGYRQFYLTKAL